MKAVQRWKETQEEDPFEYPERGWQEQSLQVRTGQASSRNRQGSSVAKAKERRKCCGQVAEVQTVWDPKGSRPLDSIPGTLGARGAALFDIQPTPTCAI